MRGRERGFTLVELAIVMVIIGIIIGAVLKGQDLIQSARMKRFINDVRKFELAAWTFMDRNGKFPGDADKNGLMGDGDPKSDITTSKLFNIDNNAITMGGTSFYVFYGSNGSHNLLAICRANDCNTAFTTDDLEYAKSLDAALDGVANGTDGVIRAATTIGVDNAKWRVNGTVTLGTGSNYENWNATDINGIVYFFDRKP